MNTIKTIAVCSTGDTWDVVCWDKQGNDVDAPCWCQTKTEAVKVARQMFAATPSAFRLLVENKNTFEFVVARERNNQKSKQPA